MPYIQPNLLLTPTEKFIKPYECSWIVIEGPNMKGKMNLDGLEIRYDSYYLSQLTLNENAADQPLMYGFLGENITFLLIRAKYMPLDPNWAVETEQYIQYYYKDDPGMKRSMGQMLLLTGNSTNRIPQIYLNNPSLKYKVYLEILMANLPQSSLTNTQQYAQSSSFSELYWNLIISDVVNYTIPTSTGSTELKILDITGNTLAIIPYTNIRTILKVDDTTLWIGLDTEEKVILNFLSEFNLDQANSRINWVLKAQRSRILSINDPPVDTTVPAYVMNSGLTTGTTTGITSGITEVYLYTLASGSTLTTTNLIDYFISGVTDNMDGEISKYDIQVTINALNDIVPITIITDIGTYNILFKIKDLAANNSVLQFYMVIT